MNLFAQPKPGRWQSKKYEKWIRTLPCCVCGGEAEPHHIKGIGNLSGAGMKAPSWAVMPLCHLHHGMMHSLREYQEKQWEYITRTLGRAITEGVFAISKDIKL